MYNNSTQTFTEISSFQMKYNRNMQINNKMIKSKNNNDMTIQQDKKMTDINRNIIISNEIKQKYADKQQNDQITKQQSHDNSTRQKNEINSQATKKKFTIHM